MFDNKKKHTPEGPMWIMMPLMWSQKMIMDGYQKIECGNSALYIWHSQTTLSKKTSQVTGLINIDLPIQMFVIFDDVFLNINIACRKIYLVSVYIKFLLSLIFSTFGGR